MIKNLLNFFSLLFLCAVLTDCMPTKEVYTNYIKTADHIPNHSQLSKDEVKIAKHVKPGILSKGVVIAYISNNRTYYMPELAMNTNKAIWLHALRAINHFKFVMTTDMFYQYLLKNINSNITDGTVNFPEGLEKIYSIYPHFLVVEVREISKPLSDGLSVKVINPLGWKTLYQAEQISTFLRSNKASIALASGIKQWLKENK